MPFYLNLQAFSRRTHVKVISEILTREFVTLWCDGIYNPELTTQLGVDSPERAHRADPIAVPRKLQLQSFVIQFQHTAVQLFACENNWRRFVAHMSRRGWACGRAGGRAKRSHSLQSVSVLAFIIVVMMAFVFCVSFFFLFILLLFLLLLCCVLCSQQARLFYLPDGQGHRLKHDLRLNEVLLSSIKHDYWPLYPRCDDDTPPTLLLLARVANKIVPLMKGFDSFQHDSLFSDLFDRAFSYPPTTSSTNPKSHS